jgi:hypothetical protein
MFEAMHFIAPFAHAFASLAVCFLNFRFSQVEEDT